MNKSKILKFSIVFTLVIILSIIFNVNKVNAAEVVSGSPSGLVSRSFYFTDSNTQLSLGSWFPIKYNKADLYAPGEDSSQVMTTDLDLYCRDLGGELTHRGDDSKPAYLQEVNYCDSCAKNMGTWLSRATYEIRDERVIKDAVYHFTRKLTSDGKYDPKESTIKKYTDVDSLELGQRLGYIGLESRYVELRKNDEGKYTTGPVATYLAQIAIWKDDVLSVTDSHDPLKHESGYANFHYSTVKILSKYADIMNKDSKNYMKYYREFRKAGKYNIKDNTQYNAKKADALKVTYNSDSKEYTASGFNFSFLELNIPHTNKLLRTKENYTGSDGNTHYGDIIKEITDKNELKKIRNQEPLDADGNRQGISSFNVDIACMKDLEVILNDSKKTVIQGNQIKISMVTGSLSPAGLPTTNNRFSISFKAPNGVDFSQFQVKTKYKYTEGYTGTVCDLVGKRYECSLKKINNKDMGKCEKCKGSNAHRYVVVRGNQDNMQYLYAFWGKFGRDTQKAYYTTPLIDVPKPYTELEGKVFEDAKAGKENVANGLYQDKDGDKLLKGIIVTLKNANGSNAVLSYGGKTSPNPVVTDENGHYKFDFLSVEQKYYVEFTYDGVTYQNTQYMADDGDAKATTYNSSAWQKNSKGKETNDARTTLNNRFATIDSYPYNYTSSLGGKNKVFTLSSSDVVNQKNNTANKMLEQTKAGQSLGNISDYYKNSDVGKFVYDCLISAQTMQFAYPTKYYFLQDNKYYIVNGTKLEKTLSKTEFNNTVKNYQGYVNLYNGQKYVNMGLYKREQAELGVAKDLYKVDVSINGKQQSYLYEDYLDQMENLGSNIWVINLRDSGGYFSKTYAREVYPSDYYYKSSKYSANSLNGDISSLGATSADELNVSVIYRIVIANKSTSISSTINELVDYYDKDYTFSSAWWGDRRGNNAVAASTSGNSKLGSGAGAEYSDSNFNKVYISGSGKKLDPGQIEYLYVKFDVNKDSNGRILLDQNNNGQASSLKQNVVEINGYSTYYATGLNLLNGVVTTDNNTKAGVLDIGSVPGNLSASVIDTNKYEADTYKAPSLALILGQERNENGYVWEDSRNTEVSKAMIGNGIREDGEPLVKGVRVQLVEVRPNGSEYIWSEVASGVDGQSGFNITDGTSFTAENGASYQFKGYIPGNYYVRFIYGSDIRTVGVAGNNTLGAGGLNAKSYNGQDFKSTTYQAGLSQSFENGFTNPATQNSTRTYAYNIAAGDAAANVSDAKDIYSGASYLTADNKLNRASVNAFSQTMRNSVAEILASHEKPLVYNNQVVSNAGYLNALVAATAMRAETGLMPINIEYNNTEINYKDQVDYSLKNLDFGLVERPKAQLSIDKDVTNVKVTLSNGEVLFDSNKTAPNMLWQEGKAHVTGYTHNLMNVPQVRAYGSNGVIQLTMDSEIMHGATIQISYVVSVRNVGEVDYNDLSFYYTGAVADTNSLVKTSASKVVDYVSNNLRFNADENESGVWQEIKLDELCNTTDPYVNLLLKDNVKKHSNTILATNALEKELSPEIAGNGDAVASTRLVLNQMVTAQNTEDQLSYANIVEIVESKNIVGRRMAYSISGNQNPDEDISEIDADDAEEVKILPPFGQTKYYYVIGAAVGLILIIGIVVIKKTVLKRK